MQLSKDTQEAPIWYDKKTVYDWLIQNKYCKEIAEELSEHYANDLQSSFAKGWEKGFNDNKREDREYVYYSQVKRVQQLEEVLGKIVRFLNTGNHIESGSSIHKKIEATLNNYRKQH